MKNLNKTLDKLKKIYYNNNRKRKGIKKMRKLTYKATKGNETVKVTSYTEMLKLKEQGFEIKEEMEEIIEHWSNKRAKKLEEIARAKKETADALN